MATETTLVESVEASPLPYDFFREVHKGLRLGLFTLTTEIGAADCGDADTRARIASRVFDTVALLHAHHGHEDTFIAPLLERHAPRLGAIVDEGHAEIDANLVEIEALASRLTASNGADAIVVGLELYHYLAVFTAKYLAHMGFEEGGVMAALRDAMPVAELFEVDMQLRAAVAPDLMCRFLALMTPATNPDERFAIFSGIRAGAPAEIFELFFAAGINALGADDANALVDRLAAH